MSVPSPVPEGQAWLLALPRFATAGPTAMKPGLARIDAVLEGMGRPQDRYPSVLVGGTNGKGSVASMLAAVSTASGRRTGLHTSPHLLAVGERMRIDGAPAPPDWLEGAIERYRPLFEDVKTSFFEATVALSLLYFAEMGVEQAVVEVGLGGRLDATNIIDPRLSLVTSISRDHEEILGGSLEAIALEKAGIARSERPLLTNVAQGPVLDALSEAAETRGAVVEAVRCTTSVRVIRTDAAGLVVDVETPSRRYRHLGVGLLGDHQAWNAALAARAWEYLSSGGSPARSPETAVREGLAGIRVLSGLRGRAEVLAERPYVIADVAHNAEAVGAAVAALRKLAAGRRTVVIGLMRDKRPEEIARLLAGSDLQIVAVGLHGERALSGDELCGHLAAAGANVHVAESVHAQVSRFHREAYPQDGLLATGSHQIVADLLARPGG